MIITKLAGAIRPGANDGIHVLRDKLEQLARIKEPEARSDLIRALVGEYARDAGDEPSEIERELFSTIVLAVFEQLDRSARYELVVRLAKTARISSALADRLAQEDYELSEPVIESSPAISQKAIAEIARSGSNRKRLSASHRTDLTEEVTDTLVARSSRDVVHSLLANLDAPISIKATLALMIFASTEAEVLAGIASRALQDEDFLETLKHVSENECPLLPPPLKKALDNDDLERLASCLQNQGRDGGIEIDGVVYSRHEANIQIANGELSFDAILRTLFEQERMDAAIWMIAKKVNLTDDVVSDTLKSDADGAILMLMLQTGIDEHTYKHFLKARCTWLDRSARNIPDLIMRYKAELRNPKRQMKIPA